MVADHHGRCVQIMVLTLAALVDSNQMLVPCNTVTPPVQQYSQSKCLYSSPMKLARSETFHGCRLVL